jgi:predicted AAA+ superfamily ATPase
LEGLPAISLVGPRACGKATSARRLAADRVSLNKAEDAAAFLASPDAALARLAEPALLDEWQDVPTVLAAVKRAVDENPRPGRFILTGSVSIETETETWPATGRVTRLNMYPLTQREILGVSGALFVDRAVKADPAELPGAARRLDVFDYLAMATAGGFPDAVIRRSGLARELWLASYLVELLSKDAKRAGTGTAIDYTRLRPGRDDRARAALRAGTESGPSSGKTRMVRHIAGGGSYGGGWGICG